MWYLFGMPIPRTFLSFWKTWSKAPEGLSDFGLRLMYAAERHSTLRSQRLVTLLILTMVPTFSVLDYFIYPEHFATFAILRVICVLATILVFAASLTSWGRKNYRLFTVLLPFIPACFISLMVYLSGDPGTPYYAGLTLCIVAVGFVFHWTYREALITTVLIGGMFFLASIPLAMKGMDQRLAAQFTNNCIFVLAKGIVIVSGCYVHFRFRVNEYILRERSRMQKIKMRAQRLELQKALHELKETEGQLIQSEKMASLGELSAGVIHEIGNPLNYSNQALFLLKRISKGEDNPQVNEAIEDIQDSIDRMKEIVSELREFSHKSSEVRIEFKVRETIDVAKRMLGRELTESETNVAVDIPEDLTVEGVKNQVTQVFINLIQNAVQAMDSEENGEEKSIAITSTETGDTIEIQIRDTGPGVPSEIKNKIFDPFFTTKQVGEGTGLGLSICFRIMEAHGGNIKIDSVKGEYTSFTLSFPKVRKAVKESPHHSPNNQKIENGTAVH